MSNFIDLTGEKFGCLTAMSYERNNGKTYWTCKCECGNEKIVSAYNLKNGKFMYCSSDCKLKRKIPKYDLEGKRFGKLIATDYIGKSEWLCKCDCGNEVIVQTYCLTCGYVTCCKSCKISKCIDMVGQRYGKLLVISRAENRPTKRGDATTMWKCQCDCGNIIECSRQVLKSGNKKDCGCGKEYKELIGKKFGRLTVQEIIKNEKQNAKAKCICECGKITTPTVSRILLGKTKSCGCLSIEKMTNSRTKHGMSGSRIYRIWKGMCRRCYDKNGIEYNSYGGRGIRVCEEWLGENGAKNFIKWAYENGFDENKNRFQQSLERKDNNKNYEPSNCKFADMYEQSYNKQNTIRINIYGELLTIKEISEKYGVSKDTIRNRYNLGITEERKLLYKGNLRELH